MLEPEYNIVTFFKEYKDGNFDSYTLKNDDITGFFSTIQKNFNDALKSGNNPIPDRIDSYSSFGIELFKRVLKYLKHENFVDFDDDIDILNLEKDDLREIKVEFKKIIPMALHVIHEDIFIEKIEEEYEIPTNI